MNGLPPLVQRAPRLFYGAALIVFLASMVLTYAEVRTSMAYVAGDNPVPRLTLIRGFYQASLEALYIAANGVLAHILLAIWRDAWAPRDGGGDS